MENYDKKRLIEHIHALQAQVKDTESCIKRGLNRKILTCKDLDDKSKDIVLKLIWDKYDD